MFDMGNVFFPFNNAGVSNYVAKYGTNANKFNDLVSGKLGNLFRCYDKGVVSRDDFFQELINIFGLKNANREEFFNLFGSAFYPDPGMFDIRDELKENGVPVVLVTNVNEFHLCSVRKKFPGFFESFDYAMISCEANIIKPDPEAWIRPIDFIGVKIEECLFIDDTLDNIDAFRKLGGIGYHYNVVSPNSGYRHRIEMERSNLISLLRNLGLI